MTPERRQDWLHLLAVARLRLGTLYSVEKYEGERGLQEILKALKLSSAMDLLRWLKDSDSK